MRWVSKWLKLVCPQVVHECVDDSAWPVESNLRFFAIRIWRKRKTNLRLTLANMRTLQMLNRQITWTWRKLVHWDILIYFSCTFMSQFWWFLAPKCVNLVEFVHFWLNNNGGILCYNHGFLVNWVIDNQLVLIINSTRNIIILLSVTFKLLLCSINEKWTFWFVSTIF